MNAELAQLAALAAHGNAAFAGRATELFPANSTFRFVNRVRFVGPSGDAADSSSWCQILKNDGVSRLHLVRMPPPAKRFPGMSEHHEVAFAGGLSAGVLAQSDGRPREFWRAHWRVTEPKHPDNRIWAVEYHSGDATFLTNIPDSLSLAAARDALAIALDRIRVFATTHELDSWTPWFAEALVLLSSSAPVPPIHADLLPDSGYPLLARQLVAAAVRGWVFGGMGSWNDIGSSDPAYDSVTQEYFEAVMNGVVAAVNAGVNRG